MDRTISQSDTLSSDSRHTQSASDTPSADSRQIQSVSETLSSDSRQLVSETLSVDRLHLNSETLSSDSLQFQHDSLSQDRLLIPSPNIPVADTVDIEDCVSYTHETVKVPARPSTAFRSSMTLRPSTIAKSLKLQKASVHSNDTAVCKTKSYVRETAQRISEAEGECVQASCQSSVGMAVDAAASRTVSESKETKLSELAKKSDHVSGHFTEEMSSGDFAAQTKTITARRRGRSTECTRSRSIRRQVVGTDKHRSRSSCLEKAVATSRPRLAVEEATTKAFYGAQTPLAKARIVEQQDSIAVECNFRSSVECRV